MKLYDRRHVCSMAVTNCATLALGMYWYIVRERDAFFWSLAAVDVTLWCIFVVMDIRRRWSRNDPPSAG